MTVPASSPQSKHPIVLTAGGTGGHMFPAIALAEKLIAKGQDVVLFTDHRGATYAEKIPALTAVHIRAASPSRRGLLGKISFLLTTLRGGWQSGRMLRRHRAAAVVGFGGYASFPTAFMAARQGRPLILHEQNAYLGLANRKLARQAQSIATSFPHVAGVPGSGARTVLTGNPVRADIAAIGTIPYAAPSGEEALSILVTGGSQGARVFSDIVPEAIESLDTAARARLHIVQQCRPEDMDRVRARYADLQVKVDLQSFFDDMPARITAAHLMICRAGASTVAETLAAGRPAIYVPYPHAADDHQRFNADQVAERKAGWSVSQADFTAAALSKQLSRLLQDPAPLAAMAAAAQKMATPDAADRLASLTLETIGARNMTTGDPQ